jgi:hypothetical protein
MSDLGKLPLSAAGYLPAGAAMKPVDAQGQPFDAPSLLFSADPPGRSSLYSTPSPIRA